jgi:hypothetical protein
MVTRDMRTPGRAAAIIACVLAFADAGLYLALIVAQGEAETGFVALTAASIVTLGLLAGVGGLARSWSIRARLIVLGAAAGGLFALGVLGIFSIGLPLLVAGVCTVIAWSRLAASVHPVPDGAPILSAVAGIATGVVAWAPFLAS